MTFGPQNTLGPFLIINQKFSEEWEVFLTQIMKINADISRAVNIRDIAIYDKVESITGQQWFNPANVQIKRDGFREVFQFSDANLNFAHNITGITLTTHIYGSFTDGTNFYPLPFVSTVITDQVKIVVTPTNIVVTKGGTAPAITNGVIVLEYLKN